MKQITFHLILIALFSFNIYGQNTQEKQIDSFITSTLQKFKEIPSLAITVVKDGKPFFTKTYGLSNLENKVKATNETSYYIASVTKSFVGLLAAKLESDGVIDLNAPIVNFKPIKDFKDKSLFENISIKDLLSHTSGIKNDMLTWKFASIGEYDYASMTKLLEDKTKSLYNNKRFRYDNFGYNVFDLILHEEFGLSWKNLLEKEIFIPLSMNRTSANLTTAKKKDWNLAMPYAAINDDRLPKKVLTQKNDDTFQAAGGMISSIEDMQKFLLLYLNKGKVNNKNVFDKSVISKTLLPLVENKGRKDTFIPEGYGLGWNIGEYNNKKAYYHFGGFDGYFSHLSFLPSENIGISVLSNENHFGDNISNLIASFIYDLMLGEIINTYDYTNQVNEVEKRVSQIQNSYKRDREIRAKRKWTLIHDFKNYEGEYKNEHIGNLIISLDNEKIKVRLGISEAIASPSTNDDSIRIEFRNGSGRDILFISNTKGTMAAVYNGHVFIK
ncbi:serine hydrolase domain-containing protein [Psychroserpens damuponensis]|uniref:serine hydrolase domain-containing protein n=1 Tax=Psychroserpens damuponensis TaxID=943936 RepID=UPI00059140F1|nr:serine hydrolase domain-containing protein [Psychroserpens damuponensis]